MLENKDNLYSIINTISTIDQNLLATQTVDFEHLKLLMLITFNECLVKEPDPLIKSYLTVAIDHFIQIEDNKYSSLVNQSCQKEPCQKEKKVMNDDQEILSKILHGKVPPV